MAIPSDADFTTHSPMQYRLAVGPEGDHGYEIGYWPANVDRGDACNIALEALCI